MFGENGPGLQPSDVALMLCVRSDNEGAFAELHERHHRKVVRFFFGLSADAHVAGELCQETFLRIWRFRKRYTATGSFKAYLFSFARNIWFEKCREIRKHKRLGTRQYFGEEWDTLAARTLDQPDAEAQRSELSDRILAALDCLPEDQRMAFVLRTVDGLCLEEVASILRCPINTVRSRKLLAIKKLREILKDVYVL